VSQSRLEDATREAGRDGVNGELIAVKTEASVTNFQRFGEARHSNLGAVNLSLARQGGPGKRPQGSGGPHIQAYGASGRESASETEIEASSEADNLVNWRGASRK
jgi:hypothetical protein